MLSLLASIVTTATESNYFPGTIASLFGLLVIALVLLFRLYPHLVGSILHLFQQDSLVEVLDVQTIIRTGHNGNRQREVVFKIINGTAAPIRLVEGVVTVFGLNETAVYTQTHKLCYVPEGIEPISMKLVRTGEGFKIPPHVIPKRVVVKVTNWS